jgi:hypothetical protein
MSGRTRVVPVLVTVMSWFTVFVWASIGRTVEPMQEADPGAAAAPQTKVKDARRQSKIDA